MAKPMVWTMGALYIGALLAAILLTRGPWRDLICGANSLAILGWAYWQSSTRGQPLAPSFRWWALASALLLVAGLSWTVLLLAKRGGVP